MATRLAMPGWHGAGSMLCASGLDSMDLDDPCFEAAGSMRICRIVPRQIVRLSPSNDFQAVNVGPYLNAGS